MLRTLLAIAGVAAALAIVSDAGAATGHTGGSAARAPQRAEIVRVVRPRAGFSITDTGIGAAFTAAALAAVGGIGIVVHRNRVRAAA
jgi:hypothetical protein